MATLFIIDQSLTESGGHHFDYTRLVAGTAAQMGIDPVVGTNRALRSEAQAELEKFSQVQKVFRETTYTPLSHLAGLRELVAPKKEERRPSPEKGRIYNFLGNMARKKRIKERSRIIRQFAEDCDVFFRQFSFDESDHVLFTAISELEFMGLAAYLGNHPRSNLATWHVQFHFSMYTGRPDEFGKQSRGEGLLSNAFQSALARIPYHTLKAYTTSDELAHQYNDLGLIAFEPLPYPVNPNLFAESIKTGIGIANGVESLKIKKPLGPIKFAVAGGVRREKGQKSDVQHLINGIWDTHLATGNVQLNIQTGSAKTFSSSRVMDAQGVSPKQYQKMVRLHNHPLPESDYVNFIHDADVGLFCYDSRRYYSRRAGILSEFLACGKPVIVPAGCWLSQQIAESSYNHIERVVQRAAERQTVDVTDLKWNPSNVPLAGRVISFDKSRNPFECRFEKSELNLDDATAVAIGFRWQWPRESGSFVEVEMTCFDEHEKLLGCEKETVTSLKDSPNSTLFLRIPKGFSHGILTFRNAYVQSSISIADVNVHFLDFGQQGEPARSSVGVIAADASMMIKAVDEIVSHFDHYANSAVHFSRFWSSQHHPARTIESLIPITRQIRRAA